MRKGFVHLLVIVFLFLLVAGSFIYLKTRKTPDSPKTDVSNSQEASNSSLLETQDYPSGIYEINTNISKQIFPLDEDLSRLVYDNKDLVYFHKYDGSVVYKRSLRNRTTSTLSTESKKIRNIEWQKPNNLYVSAISETENSYQDNIADLKEINLSDGQARLIATKKVGVYSILTSVGRVGSTDLVGEAGGDGCGGESNIYKVENGKFTLLAKTGRGCVLEPRFVGFTPNKDLLLLSLNNPDSWSKSSGDIYKSLYLHKIDGSIEEIIDIQKLTKNTIDYVEYDGSSKVVLFDPTEKILYSVALENKVVTKQSFSKEISFGYSRLIFQNNYLYWLDINQTVTPSRKFLTKLDLQTGKFEEIWSSTVNKSVEPLGLYNNNLLVWIH